MVEVEVTYNAMSTNVCHFSICARRIQTNNDFLNVLELVAGRLNGRIELVPWFVLDAGEDIGNLRSV